MKEIEVKARGTKRIWNSQLQVEVVVWRVSIVKSIVRERRGIVSLRICDVRYGLQIDERKRYKIF